MSYECCLIVDSDRQRGSILADELSKEGEFTAYTSIQGDRPIHAILVIEPTGPEIVTEIVGKYRNARAPVVLVALSGAASRDASSFLCNGTHDVVWLPIRIDELALRLHTWLVRFRAEEEARRLRQVVAERHLTSVLLGESSAMKKTLRLVQRVAQNESTVLITGETGTGKEVTARAIHASGRRRGKAFVALNLAAIPEGLLESELFGHAAGAFTGANTARIGQLEAAHGGTLFLDEIGDLPMVVQVKLLRVLQEGSVQRVGENISRPTEFRLLCATHRDLELRIATGHFREDLYYRINVVEVELPPLRDRGPDVELLAEHFLDLSTKTAKISLSFANDARAALRAHSWPGNVRELKHAMERAVALSLDGDTIGADLLRFRRRRGKGVSLATRASEEGLNEVLADIEQGLIHETLARCGGNHTEAARILRLPRQTLQGRLRRYSQEEHASPTCD